MSWQIVWRIIIHKANTYRWEFFTAILYTAISVLAAYVFWGAITGSGGTIPGWTLKDLVFFALLADFALYLDTLMFNLIPTSGMIRRGELATILTKPGPMWRIIFPKTVGAEDVVATAAKGILVAVVGVALGYSPANIALGFVLILAGSIIDNLVYASLMYLNFFIGDARPILRAYDVVWGYGRDYPVDAYKKSPLYWIMVVVIPIYFVTTLPMHAIMEIADRYVLLIPVMIAAWFFVARTIWSNGSGKSTTIKILTGILHPDGGTAEVLGFTPWERRKEYLRQIGVIFGQRSALIWDVPVEDTFLLYKDIYGVSDGEYEETLEFLDAHLGIKGLLPVQARRLSLGQRMRCELGLILLHRPRVVFLDEPTIGIDVWTREKIKEMLKRVREEWGTTIIYTTHQMSDIEGLVDRVLLMVNGPWSSRRTFRIWAMKLWSGQGNM